MDDEQGFKDVLVVKSYKVLKSPIVKFVLSQDFKIKFSPLQYGKLNQKIKNTKDHVSSSIYQTCSNWTPI